MSNNVIIRYVFDVIDVVYETPDLYTVVLEALRRIPRGKITTYRDISYALGDVIAARAIGYIMKTNPHPDYYPCYKVVGSSGDVGGYSLGVDMKIRLLRREGIHIVGRTVSNVREYLVDISCLQIPPFLLSLKKIQEFLASKVLLRTEKKNIRYVATFDLSFVDGPPDVGIGVGCVFDLHNEKLLTTSIDMIPIFMPYIPTYLAFRELPVILASISSLISNGQRIDVLVLDGQGILHPRKLGIASHAGVITNIPSIGVAKSILVGKVIGEWSYVDGKKYAPIIYNGRVMGFIIVRGKHKIIVSPGHKFSVDDARDFVLNLDWPKNEAEPWIIRLPHKIASRMKKILKEYLADKKKEEKSEKRQRVLDEFL